MEKNKTERNILIAFLLNLAFALFEFIGGMFTNSIAIISDAIHDCGDALSIGLSYICERISKRKRNHTYTFGYVRFSIIGSVITNTILIVGSIVIVASAVPRLINPEPVNYDGVIILAIIGVIINLIATYITHGGHSLNQKSVSLHMLEDVLGWIVVLIGAVVMHFTDCFIIDPILSIAVAIFIFIQALKNLIQATDIFLEKTPKEISITEIKNQIKKIDTVLDVHHIHVWRTNEILTYSTMHVVTYNPNSNLKQQIKSLLKKEFDISYATIEFESESEACTTLPNS